MLVQHAWHIFEERGDWSDWEVSILSIARTASGLGGEELTFLVQETWRLVDRDGDGSIQVEHGTLTELFKEHYNILHHRLDHDNKASHTGLMRATTSTFGREADRFMKLRERMTGKQHAHGPMSWTEFHAEMTVFMNDMKKSRGPLLELHHNPLLQVHAEL